MADTLNPVDDVFLDDEGNPIGQLVMADNSRASTEDTAVEVAEAELVKSKEEELGADLALYPGYEDMDRRQKAKVLFVVEGRKAADIAMKLNIPERTVMMWIYNERWDSLVRKEIAVRDVQAKLELARIRAEKRNVVAAEQLEQAKEIRDQAVAAVKEGHLKGGADAWASAAKVEQTILGIKEGGDLASVDGKSEENKDGEGKKQPLVVVINGGGLPGMRRQA